MEHESNPPASNNGTDTTNFGYEDRPVCLESPIVDIRLLTCVGKVAFECDAVPRVDVRLVVTVAGSER